VKEVPLLTQRQEGTGKGNVERSLDEEEDRRARPRRRAQKPSRSAPAVTCSSISGPPSRSGVTGRGGGGGCFSWNTVSNSAEEEREREKERR